MKHMKSLINGGFFAFLTNEHLRMNCSQRITYLCVILFNTIQLFFLFIWWCYNKKGNNLHYCWCLYMLTAFLVIYWTFKLETDNTCQCCSILTAGLKMFWWSYCCKTIIDNLRSNIPGILDLFVWIVKSLTGRHPCKVIFQVLILHPSSMGETVCTICKR